MTFEMINSVGRVLLTIIVVYKLSQFRDMANLCERTGLGLIGGGSFLTVSVIWEPHGPFEGWATAVMTLGVILLLVGRTWRDKQHSVRNLRAVKLAREHLQSRGKL